MVVGVDIDEVLGDFTGAFVRYHNRTFGTSLTKKHFHTYNYSQVLGCTEEEATEKILDFQRCYEFKNLSLIPGSQSAIDILSKDHRLVVVTSRQEECRSTTCEWLERHFPGKFHKVHFGHNHYESGNTKLRKTKLEICRSEGVDFMVEDSLDYALSFPEDGARVLLFDRYWNRNGDLPVHIKRVRSWSDVVRVVGDGG